MFVELKKYNNKSTSNKIEYLFVNFDYIDGCDLVAEILSNKYSIKSGEKFDGIWFSSLPIYYRGIKFTLDWHEDTGNSLCCEDQSTTAIKYLEELAKMIEVELNRFLNERIRNTNFERAKSIFLKYNGNRFFMEKDGAKEEYIHYMVPEEMELQWAKEAQEKLQIQLFSYSNCMENVLDFSRYGMYVESLKDKMGFEFMVRYFESHKDTWDSKTNLIMIDTIIQTSSHIFGDKQHRRNLVTAIRWLKECLRKPIWISDDYKGSVFEMDLPDSESLRCKMQRRVKELKKWEKCLRFKR